MDHRKAIQNWADFSSAYPKSANNLRTVVFVCFWTLSVPVTVFLLVAWCFNNKKRSVKRFSILPVLPSNLAISDILTDKRLIGCLVSVEGKSRNSTRSRGRHTGSEASWSWAPVFRGHSPIHVHRLYISSGQRYYSRPFSKYWQDIKWFTV